MNDYEVVLMQRYIVELKIIPEYFQIPETVVQSCFMKQMFLKFRQSTRVNHTLDFYLVKAAGCNPAILL